MERRGRGREARGGGYLREGLCGNLAQKNFVPKKKLDKSVFGPGEPGRAGRRLALCAASSGPNLPIHSCGWLANLPKRLTFHSLIPPGKVPGWHRPPEEKPKCGIERQSRHMDKSIGRAHVGPYHPTAVLEPVENLKFLCPPSAQLSKNPQLAPTGPASRAWPCLPAPEALRRFQSSGGDRLVSKPAGNETTPSASETNRAPSLLSANTCL
jgi:hypothetical protein